MLNPHSWTQKLKLARQEDNSCLNSLRISNFRENLPSLPDRLVSLSIWVNYGGFRQSYDLQSRELVFQKFTLRSLIEKVFEHRTDLSKALSNNLNHVE